MLAALSFTAWGQAPPEYPSNQPPSYQPPPSYQQPPSYQPQPSYQQAPSYQGQPPYQQAPAGQTPRLAPQEMSNLVAPIALYPDLLLSEVLAASTYPLELVQAQQWLQRNSGLHGRDLLEAAKQQNWDPSIQALVAFPDVINTLTRDVQWTTDLGNAFLSEPRDVMDAIQQLRASARANGRLADTPQQRVTVEPANGQDAVVIQPADPQVVYPPVYNPYYVWGPPVYGAYPPLAYPPADYGITYAVGTFLGGLFSGLLSFGGWGWGLSWLSHGLFLNSLFFSHFGFHGYNGYGYNAGSGYAGRVLWAHDPGHGLGVPYGSGYVAGRYSGSYGARAGAGFASQNYGANYSGRAFAAGPSRSFGPSYPGARQTEAYRGLAAQGSRAYNYNGYGSSYRGSGSYSPPNYSAFAHGSPRNYAPATSRSDYRGGYTGVNSPARGWAAPASHFSEPRASGKSFSSPHYSAPKSSGHFGGGGHLGGHGHSGGGGRSHGGSHRK